MGKWRRRNGEGQRDRGTEGDRRQGERERGRAACQSALETLCSDMSCCFLRWGPGNADDWGMGDGVFSICAESCGRRPRGEGIRPRLVGVWCGCMGGRGTGLISRYRAKDPLCDHGRNFGSCWQLSHGAICSGLIRNRGQTVKNSIRIKAVCAGYMHVTRHIGNRPYSNSCTVLPRQWGLWGADGFRISGLGFAVSAVEGLQVGIGRASSF